MLCCVPDLSIFNLSSWSPAHSTFRQCTNKYPVIIKLSSKHSHFPSGVDNASSWLEWDSSHFIPGANGFSHYHLNSKLPSKSTMWWIYLKFSTSQWIYEVIIQILQQFLNVFLPSMCLPSASSMLSVGKHISKWSIIRMMESITFHLLLSSAQNTRPSYPRDRDISTFQLQFLHKGEIWFWFYISYI